MWHLIRFNAALRVFLQLAVFVCGATSQTCRPHFQTQQPRLNTLD